MEIIEFLKTNAYLKQEVFLPPKNKAKRGMIHYRNFFGHYR